jgi:dTDP-4-amino-4,6-dideoxygalactose transaminase
MVQILRAEGCNISAYYSPPLHLSEHCPADLKVTKLPNAETLSKRYFQLPVGKFISTHDIENICKLFSFIEAEGNIISKQMSIKGVS